MHYNVSENVILLTFNDAEGPSYELHKVPKDGRTDGVSDPKKGAGVSAVFVGRNKFAVLERNGTVSIRGLDNEVWIAKKR